MSSSRIHYCYIILTRECRKKAYRFLLFENSRPLSPLGKPQTPLLLPGGLELPINLPRN